MFDLTRRRGNKRWSSDFDCSCAVAWGIATSMSIFKFESQAMAIGVPPPAAASVVFAKLAGVDNVVHVWQCALRLEMRPAACNALCSLQMPFRA